MYHVERKSVLGRLLWGWDHINPATAFLKSHLAVSQCKQCPVAAGADVGAGDELGAALADDDAAGGDEFSAKPFHTEAFAVAVPSVTDTALPFFVCHTKP